MFLLCLDPNLDWAGMLDPDWSQKDPQPWCREPHLGKGAIKNFRGLRHPLRDPDTKFSTSGFFHQTTPPRPLIHGLKPFFKMASNSRSKSTMKSPIFVTTVSMTPLCNQLCRFTPQIWSHIQKGFNPCIRGLWGVVWWKKNHGLKISCQGPFERDSLTSLGRAANSFIYLV
jgi:hypothetical protein